MAVYGYVRVSTLGQADGESLDVQRRQIEGYAHMKGLAVDRVFVERGVSGSRPLIDRPQGKALVQRLTAGDIVVVSKLDRAFRDAVDALNTLRSLKERGVDLAIIDLGGSVTQNGTAQLVFNILASVADWERERIAERIREVKRDQKQRGKWLGGLRPFGYRKVGDDLVPDDIELRAIPTMRELRKGGSSYRQISAALRDQGFEVSHMTVKRLLRRD